MRELPRDHQPVYPGGLSLLSRTLHSLTKGLNRMKVWAAVWGMFQEGPPPDKECPAG